MTEALASFAITCFTIIGSLVIIAACGFVVLLAIAWIAMGCLEVADWWRHR